MSILQTRNSIKEILQLDDILAQSSSQDEAQQKIEKIEIEEQQQIARKRLSVYKDHLLSKKRIEVQGIGQHVVQDQLKRDQIQLQKINLYYKKTIGKYNNEQDQQIDMDYDERLNKLKKNLQNSDVVMKSMITNGSNVGRKRKFNLKLISEQQRQNCPISFRNFKDEISPQSTRGMQLQSPLASKRKKEMQSMIEEIPRKESLNHIPNLTQSSFENSGSYKSQEVFLDFNQANYQISTMTKEQQKFRQLLTETRKVCRTAVGNIKRIKKFQHQTVELNEQINSNNDGTLAFLQSCRNNIKKEFKNQLEEKYFQFTGMTYRPERQETRMSLGMCKETRYLWDSYMKLEKEKIDLIKTLSLKQKNIFEEEYMKLIKKQNQNNTVAKTDAMIYLKKMTSLIEDRKSDNDSSRSISDFEKEDEVLDQQTFDSQNQFQYMLKKNYTPMSQQLRSLHEDSETTSTILITDSSPLKSQTFIDFKTNQSILGSTKEKQMTSQQKVKEVIERFQLVLQNEEALQHKMKEIQARYNIKHDNQCDQLLEKLKEFREEQQKQKQDITQLRNDQLLTENQITYRTYLQYEVGQGISAARNPQTDENRKNLMLNQKQNQLRKILNETMKFESTAKSVSQHVEQNKKFFEENRVDFIQKVVTPQKITKSTSQFLQRAMRITGIQTFKNNQLLKIPNDHPLKEASLTASQFFSNRTFTTTTGNSLQTINNFSQFWPKKDYKEL